MLKPEDIDHLATLARIKLSDKEKAEFPKQLEAILAYVGEISEVVTEDRPVAPGLVKNVMRPDNDATPPGSYSDAILKNAPETEDSYIKVKQII